MGMGIVRSLSYLLVINGEEIKYFVERKCLRQRDPLFSLLFVICLKYLSKFLTRTPNNFRYHKGCKELVLNHLASMTDLLVFYRGDSVSVRWIANIFKELESISRMDVSKNNSELFTYGVITDVRKILI